MDRLGLPDVLHPLHEVPDRQAGDGGDGAGDGLHLGMELPQGNVFWKRESIDIAFMYTN